MQKLYRTGATGALLDEYERALQELKNEIHDIRDQELPVLVDPQTSDENCRSVQSVLAHVVHAGFGYAGSIYQFKGHPFERPPKIFRTRVEQYIQDLDGVFTFTETVLGLLEDAELLEYEESKKIKVRWGQSYDAEQLMEHAIVHILRHRRQIEKFKILLKTHHPL
jgi:uncharacterized damage-inducible protein DinB